MRLIDAKYPGNGQYPIAYQPVYIQVCSKDGYFKKTIGEAYWSGKRWVCKNPFRIGYGKVIAWSTKMHDGGEK